MKSVSILPKLLGARWLTIALMATAAAAMAVITIFEAVESTGETPFRLYGSWWFRCILWLVWVNLLFNAFYRSWWRRKKLPGILVHGGFLLILTGGFFTAALGIRGNTSIEEGQVRRFFDVESPVLHVGLDQDSGARTEAFPIAEDGTFRAQTIWQAVNPLGGAARAECSDGTPVALLDRSPGSRLSAELAAAPEGSGPPGVKLALEADGGRNLLLQDEDQLRIDTGGVSSLLYRHVAPGESAAEEIAAAFAETIEIDPPDAEPLSFAVSLPADVGRTFTRGPYSIEILEYHPNFKLGREPAPDDPPLNPAVRLNVAGPGGAKTLYAFALMEFHGNRLDDGTAVHFRRPAGSSVLVLTHPDGRFEAVTDPAGRPAPFSADAPLALGPAQAAGGGAALAQGAAGAPRLVPAAFLPSSRFEELVVPDRWGEGDPAFLVRVGEGGQPAWVSQRGGAAFGPSGRATAVVRNQLPLGFTLALEEAVAEFWPASRIPKAYYSLVTLAAPGGSESVRARIETNDPLLRNGLRLYQSGMDQQAPYRWSVFSVARDPGLPLVTAGFLIMTGGLLWLYVVRFVLKPLRGGGGDEEGSAA